MTGSGTKTLEVGGHRLALTRLDKVLFAETGTTKADLVGYYAAVAPVLLPHLARRPVTLLRAPDGTGGDAFFQKRLPRGAPPWVGSIPVTGRGPSPVPYPAVESPAALLWLVNLATVEFHVPQWRVGSRRRPLRPDLVVFDLDPGAPATVAECCSVALILRALLASDGLDPVAKTSGSKGLQLYARRPTRGPAVDTLGYANGVARRLADEHPELVVANMRRELRRSRVLIDWSQNQPSKTTVAPYSVRLRPRPWVSTPVTWDEVGAVASGADPQSLRFEPGAVLDRVSEHGDLFAGLLGRRGGQKSGAATSSAAASTTSSSRSRS
jgi:bifunctional non-homologous end joining protein LigD